MVTFVATVVFISLSFIWLSNSQTSFGPVFKAVKVVPSIAPQTGTFIFLHWFGGQTPWWLLLYSTLVPSFVTSIFPTARADIDRNLYYLPLPSWYKTIVPISLENPEDEAGILNAVAHVNELIYSEIRKGIPPERIMLGGISQGGALALVVGLTFPYRLAGIVAQSVYLPLSSYFRDNIFVANLLNKDIPILHIQGVFDPLTPLYIGFKTSKILKRFNRNYKLYLTASGHHPNLNGLMRTKDFINELIPPKLVPN